MIRRIERLSTGLPHKWWDFKDDRKLLKHDDSLTSELSFLWLNNNVIQKVKQTTKTLFYHLFVF